MPALVRRYIKTAFIFFLLGMLVGAVMSVSQGLLGRAVAPLLVVAHVHVLLVGFVLLLIIGVATWMFPRPAKEATRYRPELAEAIYWILTLATALRFTAEVVAAYRPRRTSGSSSRRVDSGRFWRGSSSSITCGPGCGPPQPSGNPDRDHALPVSFR